MDELKHKIEEQIEKLNIDVEDQKQLFNEIKNLPNHDEQLELFDFFIKKLYEQFNFIKKNIS